MPNGTAILPLHSYDEFFDNGKLVKMNREAIEKLLLRVEKAGREYVPHPFFHLKETDEMWHIVAKDEVKNFYRSIVIKKIRTDEKRIMGLANGLLSDYYTKFSILKGLLHEFKG